MFRNFPPSLHTMTTLLMTCELYFELFQSERIDLLLMQVFTILRTCISQPKACKIKEYLREICFIYF